MVESRSVNEPKQTSHNILYTVYSILYDVRVVVIQYSVQYIAVYVRTTSVTLVLIM